MRPLLLSLTLATGLAAVDIDGYHVAVDHPHDWYRYDVSHHGKHAIMGAIVAAPVYLIEGTTSDDGTTHHARGILAATITGAVVGVGYEIERGGSGGAWVDPVDALWSTAGAFASALILDTVGRGITLAVHPDSVAMGFNHAF